MIYRIKRLSKDGDLIFENPEIIVNNKFTGFDMDTNIATIIVNLRTEKDNFIEIDIVVSPTEDNAESIYKKVVSHLKEFYT